MQRASPSEAPEDGIAARLWRSAMPLLLITILLWAGNSIVGRAARDVVPPFALALGRWTGALLILLPFAWRHLCSDLPMLRRHWQLTLLLGMLGVAGFNGFLYSALHYTTATNSLLLQSAQPALILLLGWALFGEKAGWTRIAAVLLAAGGVAVVAGRGDLGALAALRFNRGDLLMLCAVLVWSAYTVLLRLKPTVHPFSFLAATFIVGAAAMLPLAIVEFARGQRIVVGTGSIAALAYVAIFPSLIAYLLYNRGVELIGAAKAGQFINLMPLAGAGMAAALLGEPIGGYHLAGGALVLAGVILFMRSPAS